MSDAFTKVQYVPLLPLASADWLRYKGIPFQVENLTPGLHVWKLTPLTGGLSKVPVRRPQLEGQQKCDRRLDANFALDRVLLSFPAAVARRPEAGKQRLGRSKSGIVTRFVYYEFRARARKQIDRSVLSQNSDSISPPPLPH